MKFRDFLGTWGMNSLKINLGVLDMEWQPQDQDRNAAWDLYIELLTRITTQRLDDGDGDEATALASVHSLFATTREILKTHRGCTEFAKIAIPVLNQEIRPFTAEWHRRSLEKTFGSQSERDEFRARLRELQDVLRRYTKLLSAMANVEDLTALEESAAQT